MYHNTHPHRSTTNKWGDPVIIVSLYLIKIDNCMRTGPMKADTERIGGTGMDDANGLNW